MTIALQEQVVYGPMRSRRFGTSLGINWLGAGAKICNFHCVYCQYRDAPPGRPAFEDLETIESETEQAFEAARESGLRPDRITIAGNGEPTLHPDLGELIDGLLEKRDRYFAGVPVGILSNASTCFVPSVREALARLDDRFMKWDAGSVARFNAVNRPSSPQFWGVIRDGLARLPGTTLQSLFIDGRFGNVAEPDVDAWIGSVRSIHPRAVQVYSVCRPTQESGVSAVPAWRLAEISTRLTDRTGILSQVY